MIAPVRPVGLPYTIAIVRHLKTEVERHGPDTVFDNRAIRAERFRREGDEEQALRSESEAQAILDVWA